MDTLSIDIETYSSANLNKTGVYRYAGETDFEILLLSYSLNGGPVQVVDLARGESIPLEIEEAIKSPKVLKWAFNANFERICLSKYFMEWLEPEGWHCTMLWAATLGLPLSLEGVGSVLGLEKQKLIEGKSLIKYFCVPCAPSKVNGGRLRNLPSHALDKWELFKAYNKRDVETELAIQKRLSKFPVPEELWEEYYLDQQINDRGIGIDKELVKEAIALDTRVKAELKTKMQELTHLDNPNSVQQLLGWLSEKGLAADSLGKKAVAELLKTAPAELREVLELRLQLAKSSVKKYTAMESALCADSRARGMFQFYGANRTGRFSGRLIQLQNLPQNHMVDLAEAISLVRAGDYELLKLFYGDIPDTLSQLIRTAFVPQENRKFIVADFSAIEARVLAWLAGETWRLKTFEEGGDIYCASASKMFKVQVVKHGINGELRQKGKIAELALGYGGSVGALKAMGALDMGLEEEELQPLVDSWRAANPNIVRFWWDVDRCVKDTVKNRVTTETHGIRFFYQSGMLFIQLPSGRRLSYVKPRMGENRFGGEAVTYEGMGGTKKWERIESYGPKFVENIVQAISRDILAHSMRTLSHFFVCGHVHDELIIECSMGVSLYAVCEQMGRTPHWISGLLLRADGYECSFYKKD
jgi:DNA polymerase